MTLKEIQSLAGSRGMRPGRLSKTELIRALQRQESYSPCFLTDAAANCDQLGCLWRSDCR